jgi:hypothetical protein
MYKTTIKTCELPDKALLCRLLREGAYTDCYYTEMASPVSQVDYIEAFYTTKLFKLERVLLAWFLKRPSEDTEAHDLATGKISAFAAWTVEGREADQLLLCDIHGRTRSWLMCLPSEDKQSVSLFFGSAVVPIFDGSSDEPRMGFPFRLLLGFHKLYSRALLRAAVSRLLYFKKVNNQP